jgi:hypothetical protein
MPVNPNREFSSTPSFYTTLISIRQLRLSGDFSDKIMRNLLARCAVLRYISRVKSCWETWRPRTPGPAELEDQMTDFFGRDWLPNGLSTADILVNGGASQNLSLPLYPSLEAARLAKATQQRLARQGLASRSPAPYTQESPIDETEIKRLKALFYFALICTYSPDLLNDETEGLGYYFINAVDALVCYCRVLESMSIYERLLLSNM